MRKAIHILAILIGVVAVVSGLVLGATVGILGRAGAARGVPLAGETIGLAVALVGLGCGGSLAWVGLRALRGAPSRSFRLPGWGWWLLAGLIILAVGQAATGWRGPASAVLPLMHVAASVVGAMLFLSLAIGAARGQGAFVAARPAVGSLDWGALGGVTTGMFLEVLLVLVVLVVVALGISVLSPGLAQQLADWFTQTMQNPGAPPNLDSLQPFATSPLVILGILFLLGLAVPLIEEGAKSLAVPIVMATIAGTPGGPAESVTPASPAFAGRPRMTRLDGFLYGVAAGAGFALVEGMLNGSLALVAPRSWGAMMAVRAGTAALHCLATGLAGLGWQAGLAERRWGRAVVFWLGAVLLHGAWNLAAGVSGLAGIASSPSGSGSLLGSTVQLLALAMMGVLWIAVVLALPLLARHLAAAEAGAAAPAARTRISAE